MTLQVKYLDYMYNQYAYSPHTGLGLYLRAAKTPSQSMKRQTELSVHLASVIRRPLLTQNLRHRPLILTVITSIGYALEQRVAFLSRLFVLLEYRTVEIFSPLG